MLGIIAISSFALDGFEADYQRFVEQLASQAAIALDNSRLYDEAQTRILQWDTLRSPWATCCRQRSIPRACSQPSMSA